MDEFQEVGRQLAIKAVATLQAVQESQNMVDSKVGEAHPMEQTLLNCEIATERLYLQVQEISQQFKYFKDMTSTYTLST